MRHCGWALATAMAALACTEDRGPNISGIDDYEIVAVSIQPAVDTIFIPDTVRASDRLVLTAVALSRVNLPIASLRYVWRSSDPTVATVDSTGIVTPVRVGSVEITASAARIGRATVVVLPAANRLLVSPRVDTIFVDEPATTTTDSVRFLAQAFDAAGAALTGARYTWQSVPATVASVDSTGLVRALALGTTALTIRTASLQATASVLVRPRTERVEISAAVDTLFVDDPIVPATDTLRFTPRAFDLAGQPLTSGVRFTWESSTPGVATVDSAGVVRARAQGTTTLTLRAAQSQATATARVLPLVKNVTLTSPVSQALDGDTVQLVARAFDYRDQPMVRQFSWTSSAPAVAAVDSTGRVTLVGTGSATITATSAFRSSQVTVTALPRRLLSVEVGRDFSCGVTALGRGYCWGKGASGQLASAADSLCFDDVARVECTLEPKRFDGPAIEFRAVAAGDSTACGVSVQGRLYCWGDDTFGQLGNGSTAGTPPGPSLASVTREQFASVSAGSAHNCALTDAGLAYCWGNDASGQLGDRRRVPSTTPIPVVGPTGQPAEALRYSRISAGTAHTCGIRTDGFAFCWGNGATGALGNGRQDIVDVPDSVRTLQRFAEISAGLDHTCGVTVAATLYCWGRNDVGQLGLPVALNPGVQSLPQLVGSGYAQVSAGSTFACATTSGGEARCWGLNSHGQLGRGEASSPAGFGEAPAPVAGSRSFVSITAGMRHACGVATDAETWCWGSNLWAALGNSLQAAVRTSPVRVARPR